MIDIHCHILPGLDDGAQTLEDALAMAEAAVEQGIHTIIATPHHATRSYDNEADTVRDAIQQLNTSLYLHNIPLNIVPGHEIRVHAKLLDELDSHKLLTLNESRYIMLELPRDHIPAGINETLYELRLRRLVPVIAHPERHTELLSEPARLPELAEQGVLFQLTAGSVLGHFGKAVQKFSLSLCREGLIHFIGSDAHNAIRSIDQLDAAYDFIDMRIEEGLSNHYRQNAYHLTENMEISEWNFHTKKKRWFAFW
ncbi:tyrosine-protein phosphatase [Paenibacillus xerothermodurans]|uniref:Tyrosine-protein phosphatase n=1 Tax=Paenibacillus xerothermodurans TaxID=1977292 RepID=A0A2W1NNI1_PAEXE|nr:CpsB/CapC family capsule biosynthesis tyrosine phosphatase [Paenibacillus xerothermodurans]PZE20483.1 tyrosine protein phosphatase [Paenibacillus xerothermodurans]